MPTAAAPTAPARPRALYLLIASLPFSDFLQTGVVAFSAAPVMGSLSASPEDYSTVATLYAVVAIAVIALQRLLVERLGWRRSVLLSSLLFASGALVCGCSSSLAAFALGRVLMALGCASFMTSGRVLVNHIPPSPRRFTGIKFFAAGLAWGGVAGPLVAAQALSADSWRWAFYALVLPAAGIALLAWLALDDRLPRPAHRATPSTTLSATALPTSLLVLMGGSFLLLHALQRSGYDFFSRPAALWLPVALAVPALGLFLRWGAGRNAPLLNLRPLGQRRYLVGLGVFGLCYLVLGANNTLLPVLLQRALNLPLEAVGRLMGVGALAGVASWIVLSRLLPRHPGPTRYYLLGFGALLLSGWQLGQLSESAEPLAGVIPALLCNGAFVVVVLATTAMQTFQHLQQDDTVFSHANQVKNMLAQFGVAAGMALATLCLQWRSSLHYAHLSENLSPTNPLLRQTLAALTQALGMGASDAGATPAAWALVGQWLNQEATWLGVLDCFHGVAALAAACLVLLLLERGWRKAI